MIFGTRSARNGGNFSHHPVSGVKSRVNRFLRFLSKATRAGIAIGMADHNAIRHRDPPLTESLDPFYPQALIGKWVSLADPFKIRRRNHHSGEKIGVR